MKKVITTFVLVLFAGLVRGQNPLMKIWDYRFGGDNIDRLTCIQQTADGGFILGGWSISGISGDKSEPVRGAVDDRDYWIVKTNALGNKQWDKTFGGTNYDYLTSLQQTSDGGYILGGFSFSGISGDKSEPLWSPFPDYWIIKTDALGNKLWDKDFGGTSYDHLYSVRQTSDGGYILGGYSDSGISGNKSESMWGIYDYWILKTDALGNYQWDRDFGGTSYDQLYSILQTSDGGYILGGSSQSDVSGNKTEPSRGLWDYWIVKTDMLGIKQWEKVFGGTDDDFNNSIQQTNDDGFILGGISISGISGDKSQPSWGGLDYWIVKTDSLGTKQWDRDYGGTAHEDEFGNVTITNDGGYLISGTSYSPISGDKTEINFGVEQPWIVKTDSSGNVQWDKTIFNTAHDELGFAIQTSDGCYLIANYTAAGTGGYKSQPNRDATNLSTDYWIIKFCDSSICNIPTPSISQIGDTLFIPSFYASYQWFHFSTLISGATNNFYVAPASGNYNVVVTDSNGCSVGAGILNVIASVNELTMDNGQWRIYPNPTTNTFMIKNIPRLGDETSLLQIINPIGEVVYTAKLFGKKEYLIDADFGKGIYFVRLGDVVRKLIVQ